ncbi:MAG: hypothetical protein J6R47_04600 [Acholeplasmatales bacterium]|nr:hypothetical protein [Acholeplasmatales bacterium]
MYSFAWPNIFSSNNVSINLLEDKAAVKSNLLLLLNSERLSLFGDPYFGAALKQVIFQPNNNIVVDLIIDELYTTICTYIPQLYLTRNDITIESNQIDLFAKINVIYKIDNTSDLYHINLTNNIQEV